MGKRSKRSTTTTTTWSTTEAEIDMLSEEHTIADSVTTLDSQFAAENTDHDDNDTDNNNNHNDEHVDDYHLLKGTHQAEAAVQAGVTRQTRFREAWMVTLEDYTSEKRSVKRETRLRRLFRAVTHWATAAETHDDTDRLTMACLYALRTGQPAEQYAACRVAEAAAAVGVVSLPLLLLQNNSLERQLKRVVETVQRAGPVRVAAVRALAMMAWVDHNNNDDDDGHGAEKFLDWVEPVSRAEFRNQTTPAALRATALDAWALVACQLSSFHLSGQDDRQTGRGVAILEDLAAILDDTGSSETASMDLRAAAGQCAALIHEARLSLGAADDAENVTERRYKQGSWEGSPFESTMDEIGQMIAGLANESRPHLSKRDKKQVRATFREFAATVVDNEAPEEVVHFVRSGQDWEFNSWKEIVPLNFLRHCLQGGFQAQLLNNPSLQQQFGRAMPNQPDRFSQLEKRLLWSKTSAVSKEKDRSRAKDRDKRMNFKNDFLLND